MMAMATKSIGAWLKRFAAARNANVAVMFGVAALPFMTAVGAAVDFSRGAATKAAMQSALDSAALNLVRNAATLASGELTSRAASLFTAAFNDPEASNVQVTAQYDPATSILTLNGSADLPTALMGLVGISSMQIAALSKARDADKWPCVITLDTSSPNAFKAVGGGTVSVPNCGIHVNSTAGNAVLQAGSGFIKAKAITVVGGASSGNYSPTPKVGQKVVADPLNNIPEPTVPAACTYTGQTFPTAITIPGGSVYCGNTTFNASVTFGPGIHYFKDAQVKTASTITMTSQNAMLYFSNSSWDSSGAGKISFTPMLSGDYAGIAIFGSRNDTKTATFKFAGNKDYFVGGTVYLQKGSLNLTGDTSLSVTAKSGYVIAQQFSYEGSSTFTVDAFGGTVPAGFVLNSVALVQ
jgi:Putative Flp pilus-assembly TadE/G-like